MLVSNHNHSHYHKVMNETIRRKISRIIIDVVLFEGEK